MNTVKYTITLTNDELAGFTIEGNDAYLKALDNLIDAGQKYSAVLGNPDSTDEDIEVARSVREEAHEELQTERLAWNELLEMLKKYEKTPHDFI